MIPRSVEATVRRFRPIVLTALAAIRTRRKLAMIPLSRSRVLDGPMAGSRSWAA
jgi:multidrug efflux pump subunit AcrB